MRVVLHFIDGEEVELEVDEAEWAGVFERALRRNRVLHINAPDGEKLGVNPRAVLYWTTEGTQ
ncbi:MAG TPA: hypothetical protein VNS60_03655 [Solirubrobacterales bacterium]|nr:hypothetical protein [Solirubrobacterales bacterium]